MNTSLRTCLAFILTSVVALASMKQANAGSTESTSRSRLGQISTRGPMGHARSLIGGFIITGTEPKKIIVRVLGPSMGLPGVVEDPYLALYASPGGEQGYNDDWADTQRAEIEATTIPPKEHDESAFVGEFASDSQAYTAVGYTHTNDAGLGIVEVYDLAPAADSELANISTRGTVENGDNILIAGFTIIGSEPLRVIVRAIAPSLRKNLTYEKTLDDPTLELRDRNGLLLASNDNWRSNQEAEIIATTIPPEDDRESAIVQTLLEGPYTAILRSANDISGLAVVEAYALH